MWVLMEAYGLGTVTPQNREILTLDSDGIVRQQT